LKRNRDGTTVTNTQFDLVAVVLVVVEIPS